MWDLESGRLLNDLEGHTGPVILECYDGLVNAVALTADGRIVSGSND